MRFLFQPRLRFRPMLLAITFLALPTCVWAGGDASDGHTHGPDEAAPASAATMDGGSQTEMTLRLSDLTKSGAGTEALLEGATVNGVLKNAETGEKLAPVRAKEEGTSGTYKVHFNGEEEAMSFPAAGRYELDLRITPKSGKPIDAIVPFELKPAAGATQSAATTPLWRRALPFVLGLGILGLVASFWLKRRGRGSGKPTGGASQESLSPHKPAETVTTALLVLALGASLWTAIPARAHGDEDHSAEAEKPAASVAAKSTGVQSNIALGEITSSVDAGSIRIVLNATTKAVESQALQPGQVRLPTETADLLNIETEPVKVAQLATGISINGQIAPNPEGVVRVASLVPGRVTRLNVKQGDRVTQGQVVAVIQSRAIGEAQSAYAQAAARLANARSNARVVESQARAGVFSRAPLESARRAQAEAAGEVRVQQAALAAAQTALDTASRTASAGGYANPALEAARAQSAQATEALRTAQAALSNARASVTGAQGELRRRQQLASSGAYASRPVEEARRTLVAAQSARAAAQSEVATTRANLARARSLEAEGLVSTRDLEAAQGAFETATARLDTAQADERAASQELARQQRVASSGVNNIAEVGAARTALAQAQADARTREAEVARAQTGGRLAASALARERTIFGGNIANRREIGAARAGVQSAQANLYKARRALEVANATLSREQNVFRQGLNNSAQVQAARAQLVSAQADANAARDALRLLQSAPGGSVDVPIRAPIAGTVQTRDVALGELVQADAPLLTIVNLQSVALEAALFEADAARVQIGAPVTITSDAAPGQRFQGRISYIGSNVNPETRALTARALIRNPGALRPGVFVKGQIQTGEGPLSLTIPATAVLDDGAAKIVFVAKNGVYERRPVTLGNQSNGRVEVQTGVAQGEVVVTEGGAALRAQAAR
ncbi:MAG: efflux RND transporter periplasmic adaptor subunit [Armatimonadetes bacterium]|nr:efflux RND transporter periplasmic adaptor subunit [Armatimonadota bacterium]